MVWKYATLNKLIFSCRYILFFQSLSFRTGKLIRQEEKCMAWNNSSVLLLCNFDKITIIFVNDRQGGAQTFQKSGSYLKILGARIITWNKVRREDPKILGITYKIYSPQRPGPQYFFPPDDDGDFLILFFVLSLLFPSIVFVLSLYLYCLCTCPLGHWISK